MQIEGDRGALAWLQVSLFKSTKGLHRRRRLVGDLRQTQVQLSDSAACHITSVGHHRADLVKVFPKLWVSSGDDGFVCWEGRDAIRDDLADSSVDDAERGV